MNLTIQNYLAIGTQQGREHRNILRIQKIPLAKSKELAFYALCYFVFLPIVLYIYG